MDFSPHDENEMMRNVKIEETEVHTLFGNKLISWRRHW